MTSYGSIQSIQLKLEIHIYFAIRIVMYGVATVNISKPCRSVELFYWLLFPACTFCHRDNVVGADDCTIRVWEVATGRCFRTYKLDDKITSLAWCPKVDVCLLAAAA